jgi:eukaryotic-like serine/threonine-protein kinase
VSDDSLGTVTLTPSSATLPRRAGLDVVALALPVGTRIGRYLVRERVGAGGMGEVYEALDPELDRPVAIKLVHPRAAGDLDEQRLLVAEAQALAQLSHPNVVQVYDAGSWEGRVFVAMELVEGRTLHAWLRVHGSELGWREIVVLFMQIGRGLAAAHAAGIVHGDFKPTNVMLPRDGDAAHGIGRPRVFDFGLSRPVGSTSLTVSGDNVDPGARPPLVRGTPGFMAPEQFRGAALTPATDQFAFCVSLYEALWGERPFSGETIGQLQRDVLGGAVRVPSDTEVPSSLRRAVLRGLRVDPGARHESMDALLAALARVLGRRRFAFALLGLAVVGAGASALVIARTEEPAVCEAGRERAETVWNDARREQIDGSLHAVGKAYADDAATRLPALLDDYLARYGDVYRGSCELGRAGDDVRLDETMACLQDALFELDATLGVLAQADAGVARNAIAMVEALPSPSRCAEPEAAVVARHEGGDEARQLREELAIGRARARAARYDEAIELLGRVIDRAEQLGLPRLLADARFAYAYAHDLGGKRELARGLYHEAIEAAASAHDERSEARGWIQLVRSAASSAELDEAERYHRQAEALVQRIGDDDELAIDFAMGTAVFEMAKGEYEAAAAQFAIALPIAERVFSPGDPRMSALLNNLGATHGARGDHAGALAYFERAAQVKRDAAGPMHPDVATSMQNVAVSYENLGDHQRSYEVSLEVLRIREAALGPDHAEVGTTLHNLGTTQSNLGNLELALELFERALVIRNATIGPDHPSTALTENNIGDALVRAGRPREALPHIERALEVLQRRLGDDHPYVAYALYSLGEARLALGEPDLAIAAIERALALREAKQMDVVELARTKFSLAKALEAAGRDHARALELARTAVREYRDEGARSDAWLGEAQTWLAAHDRKPAG